MRSPAGVARSPTPPLPSHRLSENTITVATVIRPGVKTAILIAAAPWSRRAQPPVRPSAEGPPLPPVLRRIAGMPPVRKQPRTLTPDDRIYGSPGLRREGVPRMASASVAASPITLSPCSRSAAAGLTVHLDSGSRSCGFAARVAADPPYGAAVNNRRSYGNTARRKGCDPYRRSTLGARRSAVPIRPSTDGPPHLASHAASPEAASP